MTAATVQTSGVRARRRIVIVGGGVLGSSTAYHLATMSAGGDEIVVLERDSTYKTASSALSASGIRQQYSTPENIRLSQHSFEFLRRANDTLATETYRPEVGLRERGYLVLAGPDGANGLRAGHELQRAYGAHNILMEPNELAARYKWLSAAGVSLACLGVKGEGWFDGYGLLQAFVHKAKSLGVVYRAKEVAAVCMRGSRAHAVRCTDGEEIAADVVVAAAGCWTGALLGASGIDVPIVPRKRDVFTFAHKTEIAACPLIVDPSGMWFRPEGAGRFICGAPPEIDCDGAPLEVDWRQWEDRLWPALARRVPTFEEVKLMGGWSGYYEINTLDHNGIVGAHDVVDNLVIVAGFSGHGMMLSPAVGLCAAEIVNFGVARTIDVARLGWRRIVEKAPFKERNVI